MTKDMTTGNPLKLILFFSIPLLIGNVFQQFYSMVDTIIVGRYVEVQALAAVGVTGSLSFLILGFTFGLTGGFSVIIAQRFGANDEDGLRKSVATSTILSIISTIIITLASMLSAKPVLSLMNTPDDIINDATIYIIIIYAGTCATVFYNMIAGILRSLGDSKTPLYFLILSSILNIILDLFFILNFNMGVRGAAYATIIAQGVSALLAFIYVVKNVSFIKFKAKDIRISSSTLKLVTKYSVLTAVQQSIMNFGILMVQGLVNKFGVIVMAAFAAGVKIDSIAYMPVQDFGNAFATYVAQNKGAEKIDRIKEGVKSTIKTIIIFCIVTSTLILIFSRYIMLLFVDKSEVEVIALGVEYISVVSIFYVLIGFLFMFYGLYRGVGMLNMSIILTIVSLGTRVGLAYILSSTSLGARGIWWSIPIGWALADLLGVIAYRKNLGKQWNQIAKCEVEV